MTRLASLLAAGAALAAPLGSDARAQDPPAARVDSVFRAYDRSGGPGCALGVQRDGRVVYARGYGMADLNQGIAIAPSTVFYVASTSKQFAAFAIALLADEGKLSLDDPIRKHVPELPAWGDGVTVRHLVHHTGGLRDYLELWRLSGRSFADEIPEPVALDLIARQRALNFAPGAEWAYSNSGYFLLSVIVKRASGLSLREYTRQRMFEPLGMSRTHFHDDNRMIVPRRAEGYEPDGTGGFRIVRTSFALVGDGGLLSTVEDLLRWDANFYDNRLGRGGPGLIERVTTVGTLASGKPHTYAFGLMPGAYRGLPTVRHGGAFIGFRAELLRFPGERFSVAVTCNDYTADAGGLANRVADVYLEGRLQPAPAAATGPGVAVAEATLRRWEGWYEVNPGQLIEIRRAGSRLELRGLGPPTQLTARADSVWAGPGGLTLEFRSAPDGGPALFVAAVMTEPSPRLPPTPTYSSAQLAELAGRYASDELDTWYTVRAEGDTLRIRARLGEWAAMRPVRPDAFAVQGARLTFERDRRGRVTGFRIDAGRVRGVTARRAERSGDGGL